MAEHGKKYIEAKKLIDPTKAYQPPEAVALAKKAKFSTFNETVELHLRTTLDPRNADQQLRGTALLPHGLGKQIRVLVFTQGDAVKVATEAGADFSGSDDLIKQVEGGWTEFDVAIATPDMMGKIARLGRVLGRKGLMPNPKSGTVVQPGDMATAVKNARKGRVEFRLDKTAIVHCPIGKTDFDEKALMDNLSSLVDSIVKAKPSGAKGQFVKTATLSTSMGPGIKLDVNSTLALKAE